MALAKPEDIPEADFANYFCTYGYLYHQKEMLEDQRRMQGYYDSVMQNKAQFQDKVVLDVGTGSGILAIWAAQAGARKVYAVEATHMAVHARKLADANGVGDKIEILHGMVENIEVPEQVDIIISEWMGYMLLRESMLDSVIYARDKWMKPGGSMYPSNARMFLAPIKSGNAARKYSDYQESLNVWEGFVNTTKSGYGVDLSCLSADFSKEQQSYYMGTSQWCDVHPNQVLGQPAIVKELDLNKISVEEIKELNEDFNLKVDYPGEASGEVQIAGFCGWFDVHFKGSDENPADTPIELSTAPDPYGATHWGQQCFYFQPSQLVSPGDSLKGKMHMKRNTENQRLLDVSYTFSHVREADGQTFAAPPRTAAFHIE